MKGRFGVGVSIETAKELANRSHVRLGTSQHLYVVVGVL